ncbi:MAG: D-2-hydroxyacid dehydrogenase [Clostridia bacterium]|nr:D-2-hydroxyacid dehydrogenase [Clostridia bacterium]
MKIVVLDGYFLNHGDLSWASFEELCEVIRYERTPYDKIVERMGDAQVMITNKCSIDEHIIDSLPHLKYVGVLATGYNNIDVDACRKRDIAVTNIPAYSTESVVQTVFGLLTELYSGIGYHDKSVKEGGWVNSPDFCYYKSGMRQISGKTIGIVGAGRIGLRVAEVAKAYGMSVLIYSRSRHAEEVGFRYAESLNELFSLSDVVSLNCPLDSTNAKMINERTLALFKKNAVLINTARGGLVDEEALANALNRGQIAGAGLDVLATEPPKAENPLLYAKNTVITPHVAWATVEARSSLMEIAANNLKSYLKGESLNRI